MATIAAVCPQCESVYQVDPSLVGKRMRCPNAICRAVFEVKGPAAAIGPAPEAPPAPEKPVAPPAPPPPRPVHQTGNVGDFLPILPAEVDAPPPTMPAPPPPSPPVRDKPRAIPRQPSPEKKPPPEKKPEPERKPKPAPRLEIPAPAEPPNWSAAPPPVRGQRAEESGIATLPTSIGEAEETGLDFSELEGDTETGISDGPLKKEEPSGSAANAGMAAEPPIEVPFVQPERETKTRRRYLVVMAFMVLVLGGLGAGVFYVIQTRKAQEEEGRFEVAQKAYADQEYDQAVLLLQKLQRDYPESESLKNYRLLAEMSDMRAAIQRGAHDPAEAIRSLDRVLQFLNLNRAEPFVKEREGELWKALDDLTRDMIALAEAKQDEKLLKPAWQAIAEAGKLTPPAGIDHAEVQKDIARQVAAIDKDIAKERFRKKTLEPLLDLTKAAPEGTIEAQDIEAARDWIATRHPEGEPEAAKLLADLKVRRLKSIQYTPIAKAPPDSFPGVSSAFNVALAPLELFKNPTQVEGLPFLSLARGVLYALDPQVGDLRWARRLGVDTRHSPLRVPASLVHPDFLIAVATDPKAVLALGHADGRELWRHPLPSPSLCPPIQIDQRLLVPMISGRVEEIDLLTGKLLGYYDLGQPFLAGGTRQPGTPFVYLPASQTCLYVLDVERRKCVQILYLDHPPGSIQNAPLVLVEPEGAEGKKAGKSWLLLTRTTSTAAQLLRFALPLDDAHAQSVETLALPAGHSFPPLRSGDRLAFAGEDSSLTLFGIRDRASGGSLLYPFLPDATVRTSPGSSPAPALLAHGDSERWWMLAQGQVFHLQLALSPEKGLRLMPLWDEHPSRDLGSPLHPAEFRTGPKGDNLLFLTTQAGDEPVCLATVLDALSGEVRWQRQLGPISQGPLHLAQSRLLLSDTRGVLSLPLAKDKPSSEWSAGVSPKREKTASDDQEMFWLPDQDQPALLTGKRESKTGSSLAFHTWVKGELQTRSWALPAPLLGTPARVGQDLVVPLADGSLFQLGLTSDQKIPLGTWRGKEGGAKSPGHVIALGTDRLAYTDGARTITLLNLAEPRGPGISTQLSLSIAAPPVAVPLKDNGLALAVVEGANRLTLLQADKDWKVVHSWALPGKVTAGPARRGDYLVCVVGKNKVVVIDPTRTEEPWEHPCVAQVVGLPPEMEGRLVVADWSGRIDWLDLKPGLPIVGSRTLEAPVVPTVSPLPVEGRLYLALSDGTLMVLEPPSLEKKEPISEVK